MSVANIRPCTPLKNFLQKTEISQVWNCTPVCHRYALLVLADKLSTRGLSIWPLLIMQWIWSNSPHTFVLILWNNKSSLCFQLGTKQLHVSVQTEDWLLGCSLQKRPRDYGGKQVGPVSAVLPCSNNTNQSWDCISKEPVSSQQVERCGYSPLLGTDEVASAILCSVCGPAHYTGDVDMLERIQQKPLVSVSWSTCHMRICEGIRFI